ncbi:MAG: M1 family metallopeptidase [Ignavibacteriales bacterium]|nr:M1 family metallopeptidase [Ignavibacteriales bacterium]
MRNALLLIVALIAAHGSVQAQQHVLQAGIDVLNYEFTIQLPDAGRHIDAHALITVRRSSASDNVVFDLVGLQVDTVSVNAKPSAFQKDKATLRISLGPISRPSADTLLVDVHYSGEVEDGLIIQTDNKGRWRAFGDNWPTRARLWLPTVDDPADKATVTWHIIAPIDRKIVANGELIEEKVMSTENGTVGGKKKITTWRMSKPIPPYLMVIAAAPLVSYDLGLTARGLSEFPPGVKQSVYVFPEQANYLPGPFERAGDIVEFFARTVAPFPYEKLAHLQSSTRYGGMENASAIFYADDIFQRRAVTDGLIAHETAHQWFGDAVTPRSWGHLWLSEGFASYFEKLWVEKSEGEAAFRNGMRELCDEIVNAREVQQRPVIDTLQTEPMQLLNTNSYQKGAWILHMLRSMLGDSLFFGGIRSYYMHHRHSNATSDDLCDDLGTFAHSDLRWFFDQWLRRPGFPEITTDWKYDPQTQSVTLEIEQGSRFRPYRFPLKVEIQMPGGSSQFIVVDVPAQKSYTVLLRKVDSPPKELLFDPLIELLAAIKSKSTK